MINVFLFFLSYKSLMMQYASLATHTSLIDYIFTCGVHVQSQTALNACEDNVLHCNHMSSPTTTALTRTSVWMNRSWHREYWSGTCLRLTILSLRNRAAHGSRHAAPVRRTSRQTTRSHISINTDTCRLICDSMRL